MRQTFLSDALPSIFKSVFASPCCPCCGRPNPAEQRAFGHAWLGPTPSPEDLHSDLKALARSGIATPRELLSARPFRIARDAGVPLDHLAVYRYFCRMMTMEESLRTRGLLTRKGWSDKSIDALTSEMATRLVALLLGELESDRIEVVVQMQNPLTLAELRAMTPEQRYLQRLGRAGEMQTDLLVNLELGENFYRVCLANQFIAALTAEQIRRAADNPAVRSISPTLPVRGCMDEAVKRISGQSLRSARDGDGEIIALIDSGVDDSHPELGSGRIVHKKDFTNKGHTDQHGHGTHLAGIIAGNSSTYPGIAPGATIWSYRVLDENCSSSSHADLVKALQDAIQEVVSDAKKIKRTIVVNCSCEVPEGSFTSSSDFDNLCDAYDQATTDAIVVVAAGNAGPDSGTITAPGSGAEVLTVGATLSRPDGAPDAVSPFSSRGPVAGNRVKPDLVAPGGFENPRKDAYRDVSVVSCSLNGGTWDKLSTREKPWRVDTEHYGISGTSQATAVVSGICALLLGEMAHQGRQVTHQQVVQALKDSALNLNYTKNEQGKGLVDADGALSRL